METNRDIRLCPAIQSVDHIVRSEVRVGSSFMKSGCAGNALVT
jgi:hypothetical protein